MLLRAEGTVRLPGEFGAHSPSDPRPASVPLKVAKEGTGLEADRSLAVLPLVFSLLAFVTRLKDNMQAGLTVSSQAQLHH